MSPLARQSRDSQLIHLWFWKIKGKLAKYEGRPLGSVQLLIYFMTIQCTYTVEHSYHIIFIINIQWHTVHPGVNFNVMSEIFK
jgi:hypothetical protein